MSDWKERQWVSDEKKRRDGNKGQGKREKGNKEVGQLIVPHLAIRAPSPPCGHTGVALISAGDI